MHSTDIRLEWPKYELHKNCILDVLAFPHKYTNINCYNDFASIKCILGVHLSPDASISGILIFKICFSQVVFCQIGPNFTPYLEKLDFRFMHSLVYNIKNCLPVQSAFFGRYSTILR